MPNKVNAHEKFYDSQLEKNGPFELGEFYDSNYKKKLKKKRIV